MTNYSFANADDETMPATTSEHWVGRVSEEERWRQLGRDTCIRILNKLGSGMSLRAMLVVMLHAIPVDWQQAIVDLSRVQLATIDSDSCNCRFLVDPFQDVCKVQREVSTTAHQWYCLVLDSSEERLQAAQLHVKEWIFGKWQAEEWQVAGFDKTQLVNMLSADRNEAVPKPELDFCYIKSGQLLVNDGIITNFAGQSAVLRARLTSLVREHDEKFSKPELMIGGPAAKRANGPGASEGEGAAVQDAGMQDAALLAQVDYVDVSQVPTDKVLARWQVVANATAVLMEDGAVIILADEEVSLTTFRPVANFGPGSWSWTDQLATDESKRKGLLLSVI